MELLARWFDARTLVVEGGRALVVERSRPARRRAAGGGGTPGRGLLRYRDDRPVDRRRHGDLPGRRGADARRRARRAPVPAARLPVRATAAARAGRRPGHGRAPGQLQRAHLRPADAGRAPHLPRPVPRAGDHPRGPRRPAAHARRSSGAARRSAPGGRRGRRARRAAGGRLPGQRGAGPLLRLPRRRLAGHPGRGARPQLPGRRQPRPAGGRAGAPARRRLARRAGARPRGMALDLRAGAVDDALELVESAQAIAADPAEANALRRVASRLLLATGEIERAEELWRIGTSAPRWTPRPPGSRWPASASGTGTWRGVGRGHRRVAVLDLALALGRGGSLDAIGRTSLRVEESRPAAAALGGCRRSSSRRAARVA